MDPFSSSEPNPVAQPKYEMEPRQALAPQGKKPRRGRTTGQTFMGDSTPPTGPASSSFAGGKTFMGQ